MIKRPRRLRQKSTIRNLVAETTPLLKGLVMPWFICEGNNVKDEIESMPGIYRCSIDTAIEGMKRDLANGIESVILFGIPNEKDEAGTQAYAEEGIIQRAVASIKKEIPELFVITDVCLCEYTSHGHCGIVSPQGVDNDETLKFLAKTALSHVKAGADMVAPSDMMDGRVGAIRKILDDNGQSNIPIMSYSVKYSSAFYGPFRDAAGSAPGFGDRKGYQMDYRNSREALRELQLDTEEGADILMVKPGLSYLDIVKLASQESILPIAVYNVSGEYAMVKLAAASGLIDEKEMVREIITAFYRAGASIVITYHASQAAEEKWLS